MDNPTQAEIDQACEAWDILTGEYGDARHVGEFAELLKKCQPFMDFCRKHAVGNVRVEGSAHNKDKFPDNGGVFMQLYGRFSDKSFKEVVALLRQAGLLLSHIKHNCDSDRMWFHFRTPLPGMARIKTYQESREHDTNVVIR